MDEQEEGRIMLGWDVSRGWKERELMQTGEIEGVEEEWLKKK